MSEQKLDLILKELREMKQEQAGMKQGLEETSEIQVGMKQRLEETSEIQVGMKQRLEETSEIQVGMKQRLEETIQIQVGMKQRLEETIQIQLSMKDELQETKQLQLGMKQEMQDMKSHMNNRFDTLEAKLSLTNEIVDKIGYKVDSVYEQTAENAENIAIVIQGQDRHEKTIDLLSRRSIDQEAEIKRIK